MAVAADLTVLERELCEPAGWMTIASDLTDLERELCEPAGWMAICRKGASGCCRTKHIYGSIREHH